jgi:putative oxidoreductase
MLKKILNLDMIAKSIDLGLLALRLVISFTMLGKHALHKISDFSAMKDIFPDPLHIGSTMSLISAIVVENVFSVLLILGIYARFAAFALFMNLLVIWALVYHFSIATDHHEFVVFYLVGYFALTFTGAGKYSLDKQ